MHKFTTVAASLALVATAGWVIAPRAAAQSAPAKAPAHLPYVAVHNPQFVSAKDATFLHPKDRLLGIMVGNQAKAYPAAILSQHGIVEDESPSGPIAITW